MSSKDPKEHKDRKEHVEHKSGASHGKILREMKQVPQKVKTDLDKLSSELHKVLIPSINISSKKPIKGGFNEVYFGTLSRIAKDDKKQSLSELAISRPHGEKEESTLNRAAASRALMQKSGIQASSPFFLEHYYAGEGLVVAPKASEGNLLNYVKSKKLKFSVVQRLMAQLLLGIKALHDKGLVHRDIKPENLLIFKGADGKAYLKIADTEAVAQIDESGKVSSKTEKFGTPDYISELGHQGYHHNDLRKEDIYAFGMTLSRICEKAKIKEFNELAKKATHDLPGARPDMEGIMSNPVWGKTKEACDKFFKHIEKEAADNLVRERSSVLAGKYQIMSNPSENNIFNLMVPDQQDAHLLIEALRQKQEFLEELSSKSLGDKSKNPLSVYEIIAIKQNVDALLDATEKFIATLAKQKPPLTEAIEGLRNISNEIKSRMDKNFGVIAKEYVESGGRRQLLLDAVDSAVNEFSSLKPSPDLEKRQGAQAFFDNFKEAFESGTTEVELYFMIDQFIETEARAGKASFCVLLEANAAIAFETNNELLKLIPPESESDEAENVEDQDSSATPGAR